MRFIPIEEARPGMRLAKPLFNENYGTILLMANAELTTTYIRQIKHLGYEFICIKEHNDRETPERLDPIREETRGRSLKIVKETMAKLSQKSLTVDTQQIYAMIAEILSQILQDPVVGSDLVQIRNLDNYLFMHSVNVCVISVMLGTLLNLGPNHLEMLGAGAILHDVGNVAIDGEILKKTDKLNPEEYDAIKTHPKIGFDLLKTRSSLSFLSAHVAYQHHEREDGSGYPRGLKSGDIHRFAKIAAVADSYDAMISPRSFRLALPVQAALDEITKGTPKKFDPEVVDKLVQIVLNPAVRKPNIIP